MDQTPTVATIPDPPTASTPLDLPSPADVPRESAQDTAEFSTKVMVDVYEAFGGLVANLEAAADARRRLAALADIVERRDLSRAATMDMVTALRIAERALGLAVAANGAKWRDTVVDLDVGVRCTMLARTPVDQFWAALDRWRAIADPSWHGLAGVIAGNTPAPVELDTATVEDDPELSPEDVENAVTAALEHLETAARILVPVTPEQIRLLPPEKAADWAQQVWRDGVVILTARKELIERGTQYGKTRDLPGADTTTEGNKPHG